MKEWIWTSNYWDPIRDMNEAFEIVDIKGFRNLAERVIILCNINRLYWMQMMTFPLEFPEVVRGRP